MNEENQSAAHADNVISPITTEDRIIALEFRIEELESKVEELLSLTANLDEIERIAKEARYLCG